MMMVLPSPETPVEAWMMFGGKVAKGTGKGLSSSATTPRDWVLAVAGSSRNSEPGAFVQSVAGAVGVGFVSVGGGTAAPHPVTTSAWLPAPKATDSTGVARFRGGRGSMLSRSKM